jgi:hypothetical protein
MKHKLTKTEKYLLVVEKLKVAKLGQTFLTKEGVIHNFVGWNYGDKLVIAHLPLNGSPILEGVDLLPPCSGSPKYFDCQVGVCSRWLEEDCDKNCCGIPEKRITNITSQGIQWVGKYK